MPAQREEIIVGADMIDFQQPAPQIGDDPLVAVERFSRGRLSLGRQGQQRRLVDFTVGVDRQPIQMPVLGGQRVGGQLILKLPFNPCNEIAAGIFTGQKRQDPLVARIVRLIDEGDGGFYAGDLRHQAADFTEFHAIAADFDLGVEAPQVLNAAVRQAARPIAAAVQALAADVRRSDKTLGGQLRGVQVAARQAEAADAELARFAVGYRPQALVEDEYLRIGDGPANRGRRVLRRAAHAVAGGEDGGLRRAVVIHHCIVDAAQLERIQLFTGGEQVFQRQPGGLRRADDLRHQYRRDKGVGEAMPGEEGQQCVRLQAGLLVRQIQGATADQRHPDFPLRHVKTDAGNQRGTAVFIHRETLVMPEEQV